MLIKLVLYRPSLRWLCSDLTDDDNTVMLRKEQPKVVCVKKWLEGECIVMRKCDR